MGPEAAQLAYPSRGNVNCTPYYTFLAFFIGHIDPVIYWRLSPNLDVVDPTEEMLFRLSKLQYFGM